MRQQSSVLRFWRRFGVLLAAVALVASACIADEFDPRAIVVEGDGEFTLVMNEFGFEPSMITVDAGSTVIVTLLNQGSIEHELMIGRSVMAAGGYANDLFAMMTASDDTSRVIVSALSDGEHESDTPDGHSDEAPVADDHDDADTGDHDEGDGMDHGGAHITVEPGTSTEIVLVIPIDAEGQWELGCFIEGHYEAGMKGTFTVRDTTDQAALQGRS